VAGGLTQEEPTQSQRTLLGDVVRKVLAYRGMSPEVAARRYAYPDKPAVAASSIRRIIDGKDAHLAGMHGATKLLGLSGMLGLPPKTLLCVLEGDTAQLRKLDFKDEETSMRQFILEEMADHNKRAASRRNDSQRAG